jgi:hypothetical protein
MGNGKVSAKVSFFRSESNTLDVFALGSDGCNQPNVGAGFDKVSTTKLPINP